MKIFLGGIFSIFLCSPPPFSGGDTTKLLNFVHLCVHFYNETLFFFLDKAYTDETQKDTKLFRLFAIIIQLSLFTTEDFENLKQLSEKYNANNQIKFVLKYT